MAVALHSYSGALGAGGALSKPAYGEGLRELFNMERELVTGTVDLAEPEPSVLDLHIDAVHFGDDPACMTPPKVLANCRLNLWPPRLTGNLHSRERVTSNLPSGLRMYDRTPLGRRPRGKLFFSRMS